MTEMNEVLTNEFEAPEAVTEMEGTRQGGESRETALVFGAGFAVGAVSVFVTEVLLPPAVELVKNTWKDLKNRRAIKKAEKKAKKTINKVKEHLDDITKE